VAVLLLFAISPLISKTPIELKLLRHVSKSSSFVAK
jgi:hypothetical protein